MSSRRFTSQKDELLTGNDGAAEARVYVNNMNTPHATVGLPKGASYDNYNYSVNMYKIGDRKAGETAAQVLFGSSAPAGKGDTRSNQRNAFTKARAIPTGESDNGSSPAMDAGGASAPHKATILVGNGEELHPSLEAAYKRIMRKLQRELNYEELNQLSLAEQYGIDHAESDSRCNTANVEVLGLAGAGASRASSFVLGKSSSQLINTLNSSRPESKAGGRDPGSSSRLPPSAAGAVADTSGKGDRDSGSAQSRTTAEVVAGGGMAVRYTHDRSQAESVSSAKVPTSLTAEESEKLLSEQPCPASLRLVIEHVQKTLKHKMEVAEQGSLKDCLRFTFESRALLDRLLKEIPNYAHFKVSSRGAENYGAGGSVRLPLQDLFQEFKRQPTILPKGQFVEDERTGWVRAELDTTRIDALRPSNQRKSGASSTKNNGDGLLSASVTEDAGSGTFLPSIAATGTSARDGTSPDPHKANVQSVVKQYTLKANDVLSGRGRQANEFSPISLPETYGKSARVAHTLEGDSILQPRAAEKDRQTALVSILSTGKGEVEKGPSSVTPAGHDGDSVEADGKGNTAEDAHEENGSQKAKARGRDDDQLSGIRDMYFNGQKARRKATQMVSVGTITEEDNSLTMVTRESYEELTQYARQLEVRLAELEREKDVLGKEVLYEVNYTKRRERILKYLRETLWRECNLLRSQLGFAEKKETYLTTIVKEQQQQIRSNAGASVTAANNNNNNNRSTVLSGRAKASTAGVSSDQESVTEVQRESSLANSTSRFGVYPGASVIGSSPGTHNSARAGATPPLPPLASNAAISGASNDITAVQSLLDLALLAVEREDSFPSSAASMKAMDKEVAEYMLVRNPEAQKEDILSSFEERERALKQSLIQLRLRSGYIISEKDKEIDRLLKLTNMDYVEESLKEGVATLRQELRKLKMYVEGELQGFMNALHSTTQSLLNRSKIMDKTIDENVQLHTTQEALKDVIDAAASLFIPMVTPEYMHGYHPWPIKLRNTVDPFAHIVQTRYGSPEVIRMRESLNLLANVYLSIHKFVSGLLVFPDYSRPSTGEPFRQLCAGLVLCPGTTTDVLYEVRRRYNTERELKKRAARVHAQLLWNIYLQKLYIDRSVGALVEAGLDPQSTMLPVADRINKLAAARSILSKDKVDIARERFDNAKEVYRIWKDKQIDVFEGHAAPMVTNRLTLLSNAQATTLRGGQTNNTGVRMRGRNREREDSLTAQREKNTDFLGSF